MKALRLPRRACVWGRLKGYWREAFPAPLDMEGTFESRRGESRRQREAAEAGRVEPVVTTKEMVFVRESPPERGRAGQFLVDFIRRRAASEEEYREFVGEWRQLLESTSELKDKVHTRLMTSDSLIVQNAIKAVDALQARMLGPVFERILRRDPSFDLEVFEREARFIFERVYCAFLRHDLPYLEKVCSGAALGYFRALITAQQERGGRPKFAHLINVSEPVFHSVVLLDNDLPLFTFSLAFQELYCLVDPAGAVVDGDQHRLTSSDYLFWLMPHDAPDVEAVGHDWAVVRVELRQRVKQLI